MIDIPITYPYGRKWLIFGSLSTFDCSAPCFRDPRVAARTIVSNLLLVTQSMSFSEHAGEGGEETCRVTFGAPEFVGEPERASIVQRLKSKLGVLGLLLAPTGTSPSDMG